MSKFSQSELLLSVLQISYVCWFTDLALPITQRFKINILQAETVQFLSLLDCIPS